MYKVILILSFLFCASGVSAQLIQMDSVQNNSLGGLHRSANGDVLMAYYIDDAANPKSNKAQLIVKRVGFKQTEATTARVDIEKTAVVLRAAVSQTGYCFLVNDGTGKRNYLMSMDVSGGVVKTTDVKIEANQQVWDNDIKLIGTFPEGYVLIVPASDKKGFSVRLYNNDLNETYSKEYNTNGEAEVVNAVQNMESVVVLTRELIDAKQQKNIYTIYSINTIDPSRGQMTELKENNNYCYAAFLKKSEGTVLVAGLSYKEGKYTSGTPAGISIYEIMPDGAIGKKLFVDGEQLVKFLPDALINSMAGGGILIAEDIVFDMPKNAYYIVGEMLAKKQLGTKQPEAQLKLSDMMTIAINTNGDIEKLTLVQNAPSLRIQLKGPAATRANYATADWIQKVDLQNLRFTARIGDAYFLCTKSADSAKRKSEAVLMKLDNPDADASFSLSLQRLPTKGPMLKHSDRYVISSGITDKKIKDWQHADIVYLMGNNVAIWNQEEDKMSIQFETLMPEMNR